jgi:hypothetical protein
MRVPSSAGRLIASIILGLCMNLVCLGQSTSGSSAVATSDKKNMTRRPRKKDVSATQDLVTRATAASIPMTSLNNMHLEKTIEWPKIVNLPPDPAPGGPIGCYRNRAYIVHIAKWAVGLDGYALSSSEWYVYHDTNTRDTSGTSTCSLQQSSFNANGLPLLYGDKDALLIGVTIFTNKAVDSKNVAILYKSSATPEVPENIQDLSTLVTALLGGGGGGGKEQAKPPCKSDTFLALAYLPGAKRLPFDFNLSYSVTVKQSTQENAQTLPEGDVGVGGYNGKIPTSGGNPPYTFAIVSGKLPDGLVLDSTTGMITGTPKVGGKFNFEVQVTDHSTPPLVSVASTSIVIDTKMTIVLSGTDLSTTAQANEPASQQKSSPPPANGSKNQNTSQNSNQSGTAVQVVDCTATNQASPCTISRSFLSEDHEYFDFSLAVSIPGPRETKFKAATATTGVTSSVTTHTDAYAMVDLYPFAHFAYKQNGVFHFLIGVPVTSNPFYRPFFGGAIDLTGWTGLRRIGFPLQMSLFGGVVYMKQQIPANGPSSTSLIPTRAVKGMFGIEVPVSALISKIGKSAKSSTAKNSGS